MARSHTRHLLLIVIFCGLFVYRFQQIENANKREPDGSERTTVLQVIDGDTIIVSGDRRVRLLGIDTPETKHPDRPPEPFGAEATQFTQVAVEGRDVQLLYDKERYDNYGRLLAFVFYNEDQFLNEELVAAGLATAEPQYPFRSDFKRLLINAEKLAQQKNLGIWSL